MHLAFPLCNRRKTGAPIQFDVLAIMHTFTSDIMQPLTIQIDMQRNDVFWIGRERERQKKRKVKNFDHTACESKMRVHIARDMQCDIKQR